MSVKAVKDGIRRNGVRPGAGILPAGIGYRRKQRYFFSDIS